MYELLTLLHKSSMYGIDIAITFDKLCSNIGIIRLFVFWKVSAYNKPSPKANINCKMFN